MLSFFISLFIKTIAMFIKVVFKTKEQFIEAEKYFAYIFITNF